MALPTLAACLERAGHCVTQYDLNVAAANCVLDLRIATDLIAQFREQIEGIHASHDRRHADMMQRNLDAMEPRLLSGEACRCALRDPATLDDQALFRDSFWSVVDVLAGFYQLDEVLSPFHDQFVERMQASLHAGDWTVMRALHEQGLTDEVLASAPDVVGICVAFPEQCIQAIQTARAIRRQRPDVVIVAGGPLISRLPEKWLAGGWLLDEVDYVVLGDGETAIVELCEVLEGRGRLESSTNLVYRDGDGDVRRSSKQGFVEDLDRLPTPSYAGVDMTRYLQPEPIYSLMTSRGCYWGKCSMCSIGYQENYRMISKEQLRANVLDIAVRNGGRLVQVQDSSIPPKAARFLAEIVVEEGLDLKWSGWMKFESCFTSGDYTAKLGRGGCRSLQLGFESSDQRLLDLMCKGYKHDEVMVMLENIRAAGISADLLWFVGFPTQTHKDILETSLFLYENRHMFGLTSFVGEFGLHPDCEVYRDPETFGVTILAQDNGRCTYEVNAGVSMEDAIRLKEMLTGNNNRTLTCNGSHLPHLVKSGLDLSGLERPMELPQGVIEFCKRGERQHALHSSRE